MNNFRFQVTKTNSNYRTGMLETSHGNVSTPTFMPDGTLGMVKGLTPDEVKSTGTQIQLSNTYHLHIRPGEEIVSKMGGLASFNRWDGPTLTDSGGFQVYSLGKIRKISEEGVHFQEPRSGDTIFISPEISMQIQFKLGADIIVAFDDVINLETEPERALEAFERTNRWLDRCLAEYKILARDYENPPAIFGVIQGGLDRKLRKQSLDHIQSKDVDGIAIGGLSVGESRQEMFDMLAYLEDLYDPARPHYLMGVGYPIEIRYGIKHKIDMFDCVLPTRNGRHGQAWITGDIAVNLTAERFKEDPSPIDDGCDCLSCESGWSRALIRHMFVVGEPLAGKLVSIHNLRYLHRVIEESIT
ncbi:MAG: tRNA guanosine(34) transglycosylase Tgt [Candidatus Saccharimonadia bacterium]